MVLMVPLNGVISTDYTAGHENTGSNCHSVHSTHLVCCGLWDLHALQSGPIRCAACTQEAFRTERAQRAGMANASSGRIMVTCAGDHFGPILAEHDPERGLVSMTNIILHACSQNDLHSTTGVM